MFKKAFALFITLLLAVQPAIAIEEAEDATFEHLTAGDTVSEDGYFVSPAGMAKLISDKKLLAKQKDIDCKLQTDKLQIDIDKLTKEGIGKLEIQEKMFNNILDLKESKIKYLETERNSTIWKTAGIFTLGFLASYSMFYLVKDAVK